MRGSGKLFPGFVCPGGVNPTSTAIAADGVVPPKLPTQPVEVPGDLINSTSFTVADPRPPTAALTLKAPAWVLPKDFVTVTVQVMHLGQLHMLCQTATMQYGWSVVTASLALLEECKP